MSFKFYRRECIKCVEEERQNEKNNIQCLSCIAKTKKEIKKKYPFGRFFEILKA